MAIEIETRAEETKQGWRDKDGFIGPFRPGNGPRTDPRGEFPTGPAIGQAMPDIRCSDVNGADFDLHKHRGAKPAILLFFRSAVW